MKCYQIGNVYREGVTEMHPRGLTECGYDIVFTQDTCVFTTGLTSEAKSRIYCRLLPDAEILAVSQEVLKEIPSEKVNLGNESFYIYRLRSPLETKRVHSNQSQPTATCDLDLFRCVHGEDQRVSCRHRQSAYTNLSVALC